MTSYQLALQSPDSSDLDAILSKAGGSAPARAFESDRLEFKRTADSLKTTLQLLADAAVCFANANGGQIVVGIDDRAVERSTALVGVDPAYSIEVVRRGIFDRTRPPLTLNISERFEDGVRLLVIDVPAGIALHSNTAGLATRRLGTECRPFTPDQQREVLVARGHIDWSAESSGLSDLTLSQGELERIRRLLRDAGRDELAGLRDEPLLQALRLTAADGTYTRAAVLLLADPETLQHVLPAHGYSYQYRPSPGREASHRFRGTLPLLAAAETLIDTVDRRSESQPLNVAGGIQLQLADYPQRAVRELVVNALVHRSYDTGGTVDVEHSPERLSVVSPGGLVAGVTPENILTHPSTPRHRLLAEVVALCQLAERTGQGIDRAYREMLRAGKSPPTIEDLGMSVRANLPGGIGNDAFVRFLRELPRR